MAVGDVLIRVGLIGGGMLTSTDGEQWAPAEFDPPVDGPDGVRHFDDRIVESDGTFYVRSWTDAFTWEIWSSNDGLSWTSIATPVTPGRLTGTPSALLSVGNPDEDSLPDG